MRTILLGALAVAVLATPATARELPADILGKWCMTGEDENRSTGMRAEAKEDCGDGSLTIGPRSYKAWEHGCTYERVQTWFDPKIPLATKTRPGVWVGRMSARCEGEGCRWRERVTAYFSKGSLFFERIVSNEKCR